MQITHRRVVSTLCALALPFTVMTVPPASALSLHGVVMSSPNITAPTATGASELSTVDKANIATLTQIAQKDSPENQPTASVEDSYLHSLLTVNLGTIVVGDENPGQKTFAFVVSSSDLDNPSYSVVPFTGALYTSTNTGTPVKITYQASNGAIIAEALDGTLDGKSFTLPTLLLKHNAQMHTTYSADTDRNAAPFIGAWEIGTNKLVALSPTDVETNGAGAVPNEAALRSHLSLTGIAPIIDNPRTATNTVNATLDFATGNNHVITEMLVPPIVYGGTTEVSISTDKNSPIDTSVNGDGFVNGIRISQVNTQTDGSATVTLLNGGTDWTVTAKPSPTKTVVMVTAPTPRNVRLRVETAYKIGLPGQTMIGSKQKAIERQGSTSYTYVHTFGIKTPALSTGATVGGDVLGKLRGLSAGAGMDGVTGLSSDENMKKLFDGSSEGEKPDMGKIVGIIAGVAALAAVVGGGGWAMTHMGQIMNMIPKPPAPPAPPQTDPKQLVVPRPGSGDAVVRCPNPHDHTAVNIVNAQLARQGNPDRCRIV